MRAIQNKTARTYQPGEGRGAPGDIHQALSDSDARYRALFETADDGYCIVELLRDEAGNPADYKFLEVNSAFERLTGFYGAQGKGMADLAPGCRRLFGFGMYRRLMRSGKTLRFRHKCRSQGRWFDIRVLPCGGKESDRVAVVFNAVTGRRQRRDRLALQKTILQAISAVYEKGVFCDSVEDLGNTCLSILEEATRSGMGLIGEVGEDGVLRNTAVSRWDGGSGAAHGWDRDGHISHGILDAVLVSGRTLLVNEPLRLSEEGLPPGHPPLRSLLAAPCVRGGRTVGLIAVANRTGKYTHQDVELLETLAPTVFEVIRHKRTQEQMRRQTAFYDALLANIGNFVFVLNRSHQLVYVNQPLLNHLSVPARNYAGRTCSELGCSAELCELMDRQIEEVLATGGPVSGEVPVSFKTGYSGYHSYGLYPIMGGGEVEYVAGVSRDTTERRRMEDALRNSENRARMLVDKLQCANENKNEFIHMLSHELRNPLASIMMSLSLLNRVPAGSEQAQQVRDIMEHQAGQLSGLVDDLLDVTRIGQNKIKLKKQRVELNGLIGRAVEDNRAQFTEKGVALLVETGPEALNLEADPVRLTQVIGNLLHNAGKFTARGDKVMVKVAGEDGKKEAVVVVRDTGMGIRPERLADLFEPFIQTDRSLDRSQGGLGLGLTIVKGMVELHGGTVAAFSEGPGTGTTITIRLPLPRRTGVPETPAGAAAAGTDRSLRILIIDDTRELADTFRSLLASYGHETRAAYDGPEGLREALSFRPDVIICDIGLPGMSGYEVAGAIRRDPELRGTYLIALSGYAQARDVRRSREAGFDRHIAKPVKLNVLNRMLVEEMAGKQSADR